MKLNEYVVIDLESGDWMCQRCGERVVSPLPNARLNTGIEFMKGFERAIPKKLIEIEDDTQPSAKSPDYVYGKVYFAVKGFVVGCFEIIDVKDFGDETIVWEGRSWEKLKNPIPCKPFRGFRYKWWSNDGRKI